MRDAPWLRNTLRLSVAYALVSAAVLFGGHHYVELMLPLYRVVLAALGPEYLIDALSLTTAASGEAVIAAAVTTRTDLLPNGSMVPAGLSLTASTLAGHALQHPTLVFAIGLAWRLTRAAQRALQLVLLGAMLVVVECLDVPLVLLGSVRDLAYANFAAAGTPPAWPVAWMDAMNGGGRLALSVAAAVAASLAAARFARPLRPRAQPASDTPP